MRRTGPWHSACSAGPGSRIRWILTSAYVSQEHTDAAAEVHRNRWRRKCDGVSPSGRKRLDGLERESGRLKKRDAKLSID